MCWEFYSRYLLTHLYTNPAPAGFLFEHMNRYFIIFKPYLVLSQFSPHPGKQTLADFFMLPKDVYPVGRLDEDSEGLLILTSDKRLNHKLLNPLHAHEREYWVQVEGAISSTAIQHLQQGVQITVNHKPYITKPCSVSVFDQSSLIPQRHPPIRYRKNIPVSWIKMILTEGKNRQVRRMCAKAGFPVLRLIRYRIAEIELRNLKPGEIIEFSENSIYKKLFGG